MRFCFQSGAAPPHLPAVIQLFALFAAGSVWAEPNSSDRALATALFQEGRALLSEGRLDEACPKLEESHRLDPSGGTILNLALCHEQGGLLARSWSEFHEAIAFARRDGRSDREQAADRHIRALEPRLSRLTISVPDGSRVDGLRIEHDGRELGEVSWSTSMPVDGGEHQVRATAPGRRTFATTILIANESDVQTVEVPLLEAEVEAVRVTPPEPPTATELPSPASLPAPPHVPTLAPSTEPTADSTGTRRAIAWTLGSAGLAQWLAAGYFGVRAFEKLEDSDSECPNRQCSTRGVELNEQAGTAADTATVLTITGLASVATGLYLLLTSPPDPVGAAAPRLAPRVDIGSSGSTIVVRSHF